MAIVEHYLSDVDYVLSECELRCIADSTTNWSGADLFQLCRYSSMAPIRERLKQVSNEEAADFDCINASKLRPIAIHDFYLSFQEMRKIKCHALEESYHTDPTAHQVGHWADLTLVQRCPQRDAFAPVEVDQHDETQW